MPYKIVSININGFNKSTTHLARFINKTRIHIACIQETHSIHTAQLTYFCQKYNFQAFTNTETLSTPLQHHRQGTIIIINKNLFSVALQHVTPNIIIQNHIQAITIHLNHSLYTIINCYFPSGNTSKKINDRFSVIQKLITYLKSLNFTNRRIFLVGDFNLVLQPIDRSGYFSPNKKDKILFQTLVSSFGLDDSFRIFYPHAKTYSYSRTRPTSRLDRIYIPISFTSNIIETKYVHTSFSDHHKAPLISFNIPNSTPYKSSHWKLNDTILSDTSNRTIIQTLITKMTLPLNPIEDPIQWWEKFKRKTKHLAIKLSKIFKQKILRQEKYLHSQLRYAQFKNNQETILDIRNQIQHLQNYKQKGHEIRSRIPKLTSIDEPSPIAHITEHISQNKALLPTDDRRTITAVSSTNPDFNSFLSFFNKLWNPPHASPDPTNYLHDLSNTLDETTLQLIPESPLITPQEIKSAIKSLHKNSSPGLDGLTASFYSNFPDLIYFLTQTFNNSYLQSKLSPSQSLALIKLIPKIQNPKHPRDWRPISLLNTDYKILSSIISNRLKPLLNSIISPEQQCGLPNRQIFNNHLNIKSAIDFTTDFPQPLAIIQIDFYKAFDSISHNFLLQTSEKLGIPPPLLKWIRIFLSNLTAKINLNGYLSDSFLVSRGIRQGCPLSMLLFIIGIEPLTRKILSSTEIQGISLGTSSLKVSHYADDLTLFITHPSSFSKLREILNDFSLFSGLSINNDKTTIISNCPALLSSFNSVFPQGKHLLSTKALGIRFSFSPEEMARNWNDLVCSAPHTSFSFLNPNDSLYSKVLSLNEHFLPKIIFLSRIIPPTAKQIKSLTSSLFKFLWNFSPFEPIARSTLYLPKADGGISLPSIGIKSSAAFLWQFIHLLKASHPASQFWMTYATYNLGTRILPFKSALYSNSQPHRPKPNSHWNKILSLISKIDLPPIELSTLSFKSLYLLLLKPETKKFPHLPSSFPSSQNWLQLTLFQPKSTLFSNYEREVAFRTVYKGYTWGCFFLQHQFTPRNPNDFLCKLCRSHTDDPHHLFYDCPPT